MANISTYSSQIRVPDAAPAPTFQATPSAAPDLAAAVQRFVITKTRADEAAAVSGARTQAVVQLDDLANTLENDQDYGTALSRFDSEAQSLHGELAQGIVTPGGQDSFNNDFSLMAHARRMRLSDTVMRRETDVRKAGLIASLEDFSQRAANAKSDAEYATILRMADKNIADMQAGGYLDAQAAEITRQKFHADTDETAALQLILDSPKAAVALLKDPTQFSALDPQRRLRLRAQAEGELKAQAREVQARANEAASVARSNLSDAMSVIRAGLPVEPGLLQNAASAAKASGQKDLVSRVNDVTGLATWQNVARRATPVELQQELGKLGEDAAKNGADATLATKLNIGQAMLTSMTGALKRDPLSWAQTQGMADVQPLSFQSADADTMQARATTAHQVAGYYGIAPKFFTDTEKASLTQTLKDAPAQTQLAVAGAMVKGFGKDAPRALGEVSSDAPVFAHLGGLLAMGPQYGATVEAGFNGAKALADKVDVLPGGAAIDTAVSDVLGTALDERLSATRFASVETAKAIYTAEALKRGLTAQTFDQDLFEGALQKSLGQWRDGGDEKGGVGAYNGHDVILPPSMDNGDLRNTMRGMDDKSLAALSARGGAPVHGDGTAFTADELRNAYLVSVGAGRYQISVTDPAKARELVMDDKSKGYFVLDLSRPDRIAEAGVKPVSGWQRLTAPFEKGTFGTGGQE